MDLELQKIATQSLRKGLQEYDKRKGWRGPLSNVKKHKNWKTDLKSHNLEKSLNCKFNFHISISDEKPNAMAFVIIFLAHLN